jgi:dsRNA-specific ribonuclease
MDYIYDNKYYNEINDNEINDNEINDDINDTKLIHDDDLIKTEDGLIFNPYNPLNIKITLYDIQSILLKYGLPSYVRNIFLYQRAFIHRSYTKRPAYENLLQNIKIVDKPDDCYPLSTKSNERLEFLGDGILECVTKLYLYKRFPKENEGFMTEKKIAIVKNEAIGKIAYEMGLHKWLILSKHAEEKKIRTNLKKLGCLFEAFIGALFLDYETNNPSGNDEVNIYDESPGFKMTKKFINNIFETHIDWTALIQNDDNYKNILQVKIQKEFKVTPHYIKIEQDTDLGYKMGVYLCLGQDIYNLTHNDAVDISFFKNFNEIQNYIKDNQKILIFMGMGQHKIKRKAEQIACNNALNEINKFI